MKTSILYEISIIVVGNYQIPDLKASNNEVSQLSRFGKAYLTCLKENEQGHHFELLVKINLIKEVLKMDM